MMHDEILPLIVQHIEAGIAKAEAQGAVATLDAVEMARMLRGIVERAPEYSYDFDALMERSTRCEARADNPVAKQSFFIPDITWRTPKAGAR